jgi:apolipoprotein D and lipocalin family protein
MRIEKVPRHDASVGRRMMWRWLAVFALLVSMAQQSPAQTPVASVEKVDLEKYLGTWHEVAAIPQFFQRQCVKDTKATYSRAEDGMIRVLNACATESGTTSEAQGRARVADAQSNAKLEVTFLRLFGQWLFWIGGDYWVIGLDADYRWAIVGHPTRKYAWVLSRTSALPEADWVAVENVLKNNAYDLCTLQISVQTESLQARKPLCERTRQ